MDVFKATKYKKKDGEDKSTDNSTFKATKYKTYDTEVVKGWETTNKQSLDILNSYNDRINKSEWLDKEDRATYRQALDTYIETANRLRGINKIFGEGYSEEDEQKWNDSITSMNEAYASTENYYSQWSDEKDYKGQRDGWFQKSNQFDDGYQFGDVTKTIVGSLTDLGKNLGAGFLGIGEAALDAFAMMGQAQQNQILGESMQSAMGFAALTGQDVNEVVNTYTNMQDTSKEATAEFVKKDLYNEEAIAKAIIADPVKALTNIDAETDSIFGKKSDSLAQSAGQLGGTAALQAVGVPWWLTTGVTSFGSESQNALNQGATFEEAAFSGLVSAGAEILTEKISGGISFGGKTLDDVLEKQLLANISHKTVRTLAKLGFDMMGEGTEEILSGVLSAIGQKMSYASDMEMSELFSSEEAFDSFIGGAVLGLGGNVTGKVAGKVKQTISSNKQAVEIYGNGAELVTEALEIDPNNTLAQKMQAKLDKGKSLSGGQINRLVKSNESALVEQDKGTIKAKAEEMLSKYGEEGDVGKIADVIAKIRSGEKITKAEQNILVNSEYGRRVSTEMNPDIIKAGTHNSEWTKDIGTERTNADLYNRYDGTATEANLEASKGKTNTDIVSVEVEGDKASFALSNGEEVDRDDIAFKSENEKLVADIAVERVSRVEGFSNEAATAMIKGYDGSVSPGEYANAYGKAFKMGADGVPTSRLVGVINSGVSERVAFTAYELGRQSAEKGSSVLKSMSNNGIISTNESEVANESGESIHLRNGGKRDGGKNTQRQVSRMEGSTGQTESRGKTARIADSEAARLVNEGREVKVADLGILGGSKEQAVRLVDRADETSAMKEARERAEKRGLKVTFFVGDNLVIEDKGGEWISARAYIKGNHVFVRADHSLYTADQLMRHELGHDMIAKGEVDIKAVRERLEKTVGKENIDEVALHYADAYEGSGMSAEDIWEECICDSLGDMNIFAGNEAIGTFFDQTLPEISKAASESKSPTQTRGSPEGKASRETKRKTKIRNNVKYLSTNQVGVANMDYINRQLRNLYRGVSDGIADGIAIENGNVVYIVDSGRDNGRIDFGVRKILTISNDVVRDEYVRRTNNEAVSNGNISDELSSKIGDGYDNSRGSDLRRESGAELQADKGKSRDKQSGVLGEDADNRGVTEGKASREFSSPEEAKASGKVSDAKFSIEFADDIANKQRKFVADGLSRISSEELEKAIADTAHMVEEMKPYANILPQDKVGKTLVKNGSYDVSVENTTVCIRTLAYNSFVDMVSEKVGRPLTQMESFLVSQKLYEIAKEPQCLYCYVSLDRKAFNEMVIRYTEQRDSAIKAYEEAGKPKIPTKFDAEWSLFKEFLDGRKPTTNMWDRYVGWLNSYTKGEKLVSLSDISTEAKRLELVESGGEIASQVKDMLKYAQSASWAKKQTQYVAYYDEILKLKPAVIRNLNNHYGMRWYSFSDYSGAFIVENMQQITDAAIRGLKGLSYTKDTDFAEIFAPTGMNINISVYAKKTEGGYEIDAKQSANIEEAIKLREQYPNVGIVVVATDKAGVEWALAQEWSDVVIPFHTVRTGADVAEFYNWEIFNSEQNDSVTDQNLWGAYVNEVGKKKASKMVYPSEHQNNRETYLSICEKRGLTPRFKSFLDNPNYMKLVNETRQSESQTSPLKAVYNLEAAERSFDKFVEKGGYYEGWYNDGIDVDGEAEIVAEDVKAGKKANEVGYGRQDISFDDISKSRKTNRQHGKASRELDTENANSSDRNTASFNGKPFWSGSVSLLDGVIEEVHTIEEAEAVDFHHSMYFSQTQVEKMENGENAFFWVDNGKVNGNWRESVPQDIIKKIEEQIVAKNSDIRYSRELGTERVSYAPTFYSNMGKVIDGIKLEKMGAGGVVSYLKGKGVKTEEIKWSGIETFLEGKKSVTKADLQEFVAGSQLQIEEEMSGEENWNIVQDGENYIVKDKDGNTLETWEPTQDPGDPDLVGWISLEGGDIASTIEEIREYTSDWYGNESSRWSQYRLDGGSNYRELVFKMPNSTYSNRAMRGHWGQDAEGILVHARIQDFDVDGKEMLFIEELQSDWHNEGLQKGYTTTEYEDAVAVYDKLADDYTKKRQAFNKYVRSGEFRSDPDEVSKKKFDWLRSKMDTAEKRMQEAERDIEALKAKGMGDVPDAPFRSTYHEYVLKRLLRMAAEEGYDSIGWTIADTQSKRWSYDYEKAYQIEYDQEMPKFLRKYGKQWGATVGKSSVGDTEIWSMDITDSMKDSVLYEGQPKYSRELDLIDFINENAEESKPLSNREILANALETTAQKDEERNLLQNYKDNIHKLDEDQAELREVMEKIDKIQYRKSLSILDEKLSVAEFERRAKAKAKKNGISEDEVKFKLDRSNSKYIAYAVGHGTILEADKTFRSAEEKEKLQELDQEAKYISDRINTYDRELLRLEAMKPIKDVLQREKAMLRKRLMNHYQESRKVAVERVRESAAKTEAKVKLQKLILQTSKWISYPGKDDVKCPDILRGPYAKFLEGIDLSSKRSLQGGEPTHNDERVANAMNNLANAIERITNAQNPSVETDKVLDSGYLDLPVEFVAKLREMAENISNMMVEGDYVVNKMSATDVKQLSKLIRTLNHAIKEMSTLYANLRFANVEALGDNSMSFLESIGEAKGENAITDFVAWDNALPYYAFKRFGEGGESIFEGLMNGQDKLARLAKIIFDFKDKTWTDKESKSWSEDTHTITLPNGNTLTLTTANAMGIYCLSRREQGLQHLLGGGTRVIGIKKGAKKATDSRSTLTMEDINAIVASLTDRQKQVALAMQKFMSETCSEWGNEVSMKRFLTKEFTDPNYYPIESNDENLSAKDPQAQQSDLYRLLNISATKPLAPGANNEVIIRNIFDVFIEHTSDMAKLNAYGLPLLDYMKWANYREKSVNDNGQITVRGVHKSMTRAYGDKAWSYVLNLIKDVNGRHNDNGDNTFLMNMMRMQKTASVGNNLRVAFLQFTSYPRASLVLSSKSLALGLTKKPQIEKAKKYCGIALWKSYGFYDTNIARSIEDQLKGTTNIRQKIIELSMKGPEFADAITWGALWNACEYEVAKTTKNKVGSEEFYQEVGLKLRDVVYATQVVDSILTRSQIMRSKSGLTQTATAYMSEPTLTANILMDAGFQFQKEKRISGSAKTAWKKTGKIVVGAVGNYCLLQLITSIAESLADAWRDDDEEEFIEKFGEAFGENLVTNLIPFNKIPIISDIADLLLSFVGIGFVSSDNLSTSWLTQAANAVKTWTEVLGEELGGEKTLKTVYNAIYQTAKALSSVTGISVSGAMREVVALWNNTAGTFDSSLKIRQYELTEEDKRNALYKAILSGDEKEIEKCEAEYKDQNEIDSVIRKALRENDTRIKEAAEAYLNGDYATYNELREGIVEDGVFSRKIVTEALKAEYNYLKKKAEEAEETE